jgi:Xaa-Pro dipeptidase
MEVRKELAFSPVVYEERLKRLRERMEAAGVDVLLVFSPENIFYLNGYNTPGHYYGYQAYVVPLARDPFMVVRQVEVSNVVHRSVVEKRVVFGDMDNPALVTSRALVAEGLDKMRIGLHKGDFYLSAANYETLRESVPDAKFVEGFGLVEEMRLVKSREEMECIEKAARASEAGMKAGIEAVQVGRTEDKVAAAVYQAIILAGSEYPGMAPMIASGWRSGVAHATWEGHRKMEKGDVVLLEIPACIKRYHAVHGRSVVIGPPSDEAKRAWDGALGARRAGIEAIKPGVLPDVPYHAVRDAMAKAGYGEQFLHRAAYSLGIAYPPRWEEGAILSLREGERFALQPNMVFHLVTAVYLPEACVACSDTVKVTDSGCEVVTTTTTELISGL